MLTDAQIRRAKPAAKPYKLTDGGGLHLFITPAATKLWRLRYERGEKEQLLSLGRYPDLSLAEARIERDRIKALLRAGGDPKAERRERAAQQKASAEDTFEKVAREWHEVQKPRWTKTHADDVLSSLERDVFPDLGGDPIRSIPPRRVLDVLRKVEQRGAPETARRIRQRISAVFVYAIATGAGENDPAAIVQGAMAPVVKGRQPAVTDLEEAREMLRKAEAIPAYPVTKLGLRFLALTVVRPGELRGAPWEELGDEAIRAACWTVPAPRMKMKRDHMVPLASQALDVLEVLRTLTGRGPLAFPNARHAHRPMTENAIGYLLNRAGYHHKHVPHGWRATFSTVMNERFPEDRHVIDLMLAHAPKDKVEAAYNRALHLKRRVELAQIWADMLLEGFPPAADLLKGRRW